MGIYTWVEMEFKAWNPWLNHRTGLNICIVDLAEKLIEWIRWNEQVEKYRRLPRRK